MAVNCWVVPSGSDGFCGVIAIETSPPAALTVRFAFPLTEPELAEIVVVPAPVLVANPLLPAVLLIVATLATEEPQCAELVTSWVEPSVNKAAAVNC